MNTLVAGNHDLGGEVPDCAGGYHNGNFNLIGDGTGCTFAAAVYDIVGTAVKSVDPLLVRSRTMAGRPRPTLCCPAAQQLTRGTCTFFRRPTSAA